MLIVEKRTEDRTAFAAGAEARAKASADRSGRGGVFQPDFKRIVDGLPVAMVIVDSNGLVRYKNALAAQLFYDIGFVSNLDGMRYESFRLHPESGRPGKAPPVRNRSRNFRTAGGSTFAKCRSTTGAALPCSTATSPGSGKAGTEHRRPFRRCTTGSKTTSRPWRV